MQPLSLAAIVVAILILVTLVGARAGNPAGVAPSDNLGDPKFTSSACGPGYTSNGTFCIQKCPPGFESRGATCVKPKALARGKGYPSQAVCMRNSGKNCERCPGSHGYPEWYPVCPERTRAFDCEWCIFECPPGMKDMGATCLKDVHPLVSATHCSDCRL